MKFLYYLWNILIKKFFFINIGMCIFVLEGEWSYYYNGGSYGGYDGEINII